MSSDSLDFTNLTCGAFAESLAAREPVPGGGGAAAYVGALGAALASMVSNYTIGKKRYAAVEADVRHVLARATRIRAELVALVDADARAYALVARAHKLPKDDPDRPRAVEAALHEAALPPYRMMVSCARAVALHEELAEKGSRMLAADVACGAVLCRAAMEAASVNVFANTSLMGDRARAAELEQEADALLSEWRPRADAVAAGVVDALRKEA